MLPAIMLIGLFGIIAMAARRSDANVGVRVEPEQKQLGPSSKKEREKIALLKNLKAQIELANARQLPEDFLRVSIAAKKLGRKQTAHDAEQAAKWYRGKLVRQLIDQLSIAEGSKRSVDWLRVADTAQKAGRPDLVERGRKNAVKLRSIGR